VLIFWIAKCLDNTPKKTEMFRSSLKGTVSRGLDTFGLETEPVFLWVSTALHFYVEHL
jgi:hypothetical protein